MSATLRRILIAVTVSLFFSVACLAQTAAFEGDVKGEDGKPLKGAVIKIERLDIKGKWETKTDKKGHYYYGGLQSGNYKISVEVDGAVKDQVSNIRARLGDPNSVPFDLQKVRAEVQQQQKAVEGGAPIPKDQEKAMTAEQKAAFEKAKKEREQAMAKNKALNDAFNAGREAMAANQWDAAVDTLQKASEMDATQHVVFANLGDAYVGRAKTKAGPDKDADLEKANAAYSKAIELKPDDAAYHNNYALALAQSKKFTEAQAELTKAAQLEPAAAGKYYYNLGAVLVNTNPTDTTPAMEAFKKAIDADPNYADAYYQYGISLMGKATTGADGKMTPVPGTAEALQKYLELAPNGKDAETAKAMLQMIGASIETEFSKPGAKKQTPKKKN
jgi:tetratricopeptide (TPR) repeat protein